MRSLVRTHQSGGLKRIGAKRDPVAARVAKLSSDRPGLLQEIATTRARALSDEIAKLEAEAEELKNEINELTGVEEQSVA
jgi:cell division protein FtsB